MVSTTVAGIICIIALLILIFLSFPVGLSFILSGLIGTFLILDVNRALTLLMKSSFESIATPSWVAIPLFILLGSLAVETGLARRAYQSADGLASGLPGSVGIATTLANAVFGAISGASIAAVTVFGRAALPEMLRLRYSKSFASGIIASAGTFASMIPPSTMFIIYALFSNTSIAGLFFAGIIPGLLNALLFSIYIYFKAKNDKSMMDRYQSKEKIALKERFSLIVSAWPILLVAFIILGGIYKGFFTPTEAAAVGCFVVVAVGIISKSYKFNFKNLGLAFRNTANSTSMLFLINIGALFYAQVLVLSHIPSKVTIFFTSLPVAPVMIIIIICILYFLMGMIMVPIGIYAMTLPIIIPIITSLGYDPIWFGVVSMLLMEIGAITPPVGLNVYALKGVVSKDITVTDIFKGCWPFVFIDIVLLIILIAFPQISLWLPNLLMN